MTDYITLLGAEQLSRAGHEISYASDRISSAASTMDNSVFQLRQVLDDFLVRFEHQIDRLKETGK